MLADIFKKIQAVSVACDCKGCPYYPYFIKTAQHMTIDNQKRKVQKSFIKSTLYCQIHLLDIATLEIFSHEIKDFEKLSVDQLLNS